MKWNDNLPDVSAWQPRSNRSATLSRGLLVTCQAAQRRIIREAEIEREFNVDHYDSGSGLEDLVREELAKLLPARYLVDAGVVNDRDGRTAGDYEIVVRDGVWAPVTKLGATPASRRYHFPIESIYSAIEVKQTLGFQQLDDAMEKLVKLARLNRPGNPYGHITENQHLQEFDKEGWILNPLHTVIFGTRIRTCVAFRDLALRFGEINACLDRREMITMLCVLGHGAAWYSVRDGGAANATFMGDRDQHLQLSIHDKDPEKTFYRFFVHLSGHLHRSVLGSQNIADSYGKDFLRACNVDRWSNALYNSKPLR